MDPSILLGLIVLGVVGWQVWQRQLDETADEAAARTLAEQLATLEDQMSADETTTLTIPADRPEDIQEQLSAGLELGAFVGELFTESGGSAAEAALWGGAGGALLLGPWGAALAAGIAFQSAHAARMEETAQFREIEFMLSNEEWGQWRRKKNDTAAHPLSINAENNLHTYEGVMIRKYMHDPELGMPGTLEFAERVRSWAVWEYDFTNPKTLPMLEAHGVTRGPSPITLAAAAAAAATDVTWETLPWSVQHEFFDTGGLDTWGSLDAFLAAREVSV